MHPRTEDEVFLMRVGDADAGIDVVHVVADHLVHVNASQVREPKQTVVCKDNLPTTHSRGRDRKKRKKRKSNLRKHGTTTGTERPQISSFHVKTRCAGADGVCLCPEV